MYTTLSLLIWTYMNTSSYLSNNINSRWVVVLSFWTEVVRRQDLALFSWNDLEDIISDLLFIEGKKLYLHEGSPYLLGTWMQRRFIREFLRVAERLFSKAMNAVRI